MVLDEIKQIRENYDILRIESSSISSSTHSRPDCATTNAGFGGQAFAQLIGASIRSPSPSTISFLFECTVYPSILLHLAEFGSFGGAKLWQIVTKRIPPEVDSIDIDSPKSESEWASFLCILSQHAVTRRIREELWLKIEGQYCRSISGVELIHINLARFHLPGDVGFVDIHYDHDLSSTISSMNGYLSEGVEIYSFQEEKQRITHLGPWSTSVEQNKKILNCIGVCVKMIEALGYK